MQRIMLKAVKVPVVVDQTIDTEICVKVAYNGTVTFGVGREPFPAVTMELSREQACELAKMLLVAATEPPPF